VWSVGQRYAAREGAGTICLGPVWVLIWDCELDCSAEGVELSQRAREAVAAVAAATHERWFIDRFR